MSTLSRITTTCAVLGVAITLLMQGVTVAQDVVSPLTLTSDDGHRVHIFPAPAFAALLAADTGPLIYHTNGPVMQAGVTAYAIFWVPAKLQNGGATSMTAHYQTVQTNMLGDYAGHGIGSNNTQYYETIKSINKKYIQDKGGFGGSYVDTSAYPTSGCTDSVTPGNCITDAQVQAEIKKVMGLNGWTGGLSKIFFLFTSSGEGSCFTSASTSCAYTNYCAYHGAISGTTPIVYGNEPYGASSLCNTAPPSPNSDPDADTAATALSHELTEAITDPQLNAWFTAQGNEIGDLCAYNYGTNSWDSAKANQMWNGRFYELQMEFDNHKGGCVQVGP
jgi:hypothetical protein